jgi:methyl-accepting chemotaxis protein
MKMFQSVGGRISLGFGVLAAIVAIVGAAAIGLMFNAASLFNDYRDQARESLEVNAYLLDVETLRLNYLEFIRQPSPDAATAVEVMIEDVATTDADGLARFEGDDVALADIARSAEMAAQYATLFATVKAGIEAGKVVDNIPESAAVIALGKDLEQLYVGMSDRIEEVQNTLGPQIAAQQQLQVLIISAIAGLGLIVGIVLAFLTARWLSRAITGLTGTMRVLANGQYDIEIKGAEQPNELGEMARALETFRTNGLEVAGAEIEKQRRADEASARAETMARFQASFDMVISRATEGDFGGRIDERFGNGDLDRVADNLNGMMGTVEAALGEADRVLGALANADLRDRMVGSYKGAFEKLKGSTNSVADKLEHILTDLRETSRSLKLATGEILSGANDLSERTTKQAATIEETSATMEQVANTVSLNADRASEASQSAERVTSVVEASGAVMSEATDAMERITQSSAKISNIIGLIDDIAFQTNLLALNASVEAARAGEAGKGFAVVAVEVRRLAQSAAQASAEVKVLIEQSASEVSNGSRLVADVAGRLNDIVEGVRATSKLMESIAIDSKAQASGISEVNVAVRQMDEMTQHNAALVEEMNASIEQTEGQAGKLDVIVDTFTLPSQAGSRPRAVAASPSAAPAETGARGLMGKVKKAAQAYFGGAAAEDWNEF